MEYYIGIDMGTSAVKLTAINEQGMIKGSTECPYQYDEPKAGWKEIWPTVWAEGMKEGLKKLLSGLDKNCVKAIGVTGQMHTTVFLDAKGSCIRPAIMWNDIRSKDYFPALKESLSEADTRTIAKIISTGSPAVNILWLKDAQPDAFQKLDKFLIGPDYLVYYLTGHYSTDYCEASTSSLYDTEHFCWSETMRQMIGLSKNQYPPINGSQQVVGYLRKELQEAFSLPGGVKVIAGTGDNAAAAMAAGCLEHPAPLLSIGTSAVLVLSTAQRVENAKGKEILFSLDGSRIHYLVQGVVQSAGGSYDWWVKKILKAEDFGSISDSINLQEPIKNDLLFYPHLTGDKTIYADPTLRGSFWGLNIHHGSADLTRAVMEGISMAIKQLAEEMQISFKKQGQLKVTGGAAKSKVWLQILADVLNVEIQKLNPVGGASYGAAKMAAMSISCEAKTNDNGVLLDKTLLAAKISTHVSPRTQQVKLYEQKYQKYLKIHKAIKLIEQ